MEGCVLGNLGCWGCLVNLGVFVGCAMDLWGTWGCPWGAG